ncbi:MAG: hypothetical protein H6873_05475 [Hyphomicrobiaceae bacterium]|nr:hypothetical protein [Hyphomicrobiaceae bacterium]
MEKLLEQAREWHLMAAAAGGAIAVAALPAQNDDALVLGVGLVLLGIGRAMNTRVEILVRDIPGVASATIRQPVFVWGWRGGLVMALGLLLGALGLWRIAWPLVGATFYAP